MTSSLPPNLLWKDFAKVWQCKQRSDHMYQKHISFKNFINHPTSETCIISQPTTVDCNGTICIFVYISVTRRTLVGPGPVVTEFERKVYAEDAEKMDLSGTEEKIFQKRSSPH